MPRSRSKPVQERARQTRGAIIDAALEVLGIQGVAKATTHRIAQRAGVSVGTLYQYFSNKAEVFEALSERYVNRFLAGMVSDHRELAEMPRGEAIDTLMGRLVSTLVAHPKTARTFLKHRESIVPRETMRKRRERLEEGILELFKGDLPGDDPKISAFVVVTITEALLTKGFIEKPEWAENGGLEKELAHLLKLYLQA